MTIWKLLESIKTTLENELSGLNFKDKNGKNCTLNFYLQSLPIASSVQTSSANEQPFPWITIRYTGSEDISEKEQGNAKVSIIVGVYDKDNMCQGYQDSISITEKIRQCFLRQPIVGNMFQLVFPLKQIAYDDFSNSTHPYYFGAVETIWAMPIMNTDKCLPNGSNNFC